MFILTKLPDVLQKRSTAPTLRVHAINYLKTKTGPFGYALSVVANLRTQTRRVGTRAWAPS